jgi:hypothetical protein
MRLECCQVGALLCWQTEEVIKVKGKAAIAVLLNHGRQAAIRKMETLYSLAEMHGYHVFEEMFREKSFRSTEVSEFRHVDTVFVDELKTLGKTQKECMTFLNRLFRIGIYRVYVLSDEDVVEINYRVFEALRLFEKLDVVLTVSNKSA